MKMEDHIGSSATTNGFRNLSRNQILTLISAASLNFSSMICYSILGPFFPQEALKKGVSHTVIGLIFGCFAVWNFLSTLILGRYIVQIGAKFMFVMGLLTSAVVNILFGLLDKAPDGTVFIVLCFVIRSVNAVGFAAAITASSSVLAKSFPNNIATAMGSLEIFSGLGMILGPPIGGILYQKFGYEVPFISLGCVVLLMVPLNIFILPKYESMPSEGSLWTLVKIPKVMLMCFTIFSLSSCLGFLDPTMSLFVTNTKLRKWLVIIGNLGTAFCFFMLGPAPIFQIESKLWLFVFILVLDGFFIGLSCIPVYPEMLDCAYENGFEEGLSTLGLISGLFGAMWSAGSFIGPTLGGFLNEKFDFRWAAAMQGLLPLVAFVLTLSFYTFEIHKRKQRSHFKESNGTIQERQPLIAEAEE